MNRIFFFMLMLLAAFDVPAQYQLSDTVYVQHFDSLQSGLPEGWMIGTEAKDMALGAAATLQETPATTTRWNNAGGGFKNVASANGFMSYKSATAALQLAAGDRALGVRQTGSFGDPGAAFTFQVDHTYGLSDFELSFKLQGLDSNSGRSSEWLVQYAIGDSPFVFMTQAAFRTGGFTFENKSVLVRFGAALDQQAERVWIRIATLAASTGSGSRTTSAIDDFELRWKGVAIPGYRPLVQRMFPPNGAADVKPGSILSVKFSRHISLGATGNVRVKNETDNTVQTIAAGSASLSVSGRDLLIADVLLDPEKTYHITFDSSIVDTAGAGNYAWEDTAAWRFTTAPLLRVPQRVGSTGLFVLGDGSGNAELLLSGMLPGSYTIALYNASGRQLSKQDIALKSDRQVFRFPGAELPSGLYVVRVYGQQVQLAQKFMICR